MPRRPSPLWVALATTLVLGCPRTTELDVGVDAPAALPDAPSMSDAPRSDTPAPTDVPRDVPGDVPVDVRRDSGMEPDAPLGGMTLTYVVNTMDVPEPDFMDRLPGFDLDGMVSEAFTDACDDAYDYVSPFSGDPGIDDQYGANFIGLLAGMLTGGVAGTLEEGFARGTNLLVFEVRGVESFTSDASVVVHVAQARTASGLPPVLVSGRLAPGQSFVEVTSLGTMPATIVGGRLEGRFDGYRLILDPSGGTGALPLRDALFGAAISPTRLVSGEVGARATVADVVTHLNAVGFAADEATVRAVTAPDLMPNADASVCDGISIGATFEAVEAAPL